jgi:hypothetical protein
VEQGSFPAGNNYSIVFYRTENGTLQEYRVNVGGTKTFDCAYVQWKNETTVIVRLCNTKNQQEMRCVVSGHDGWTGVQVD